MFNIKPSDLEAVALAVSTEETRYYLNGVNLEKYTDGHAIGMIATDGHRFHSVDFQREGVIKESFIFHSSDIARCMSLVKHAKKEHGKLLNLIRIVITRTEPKLLVRIGLVDGEDSDEIVIESGSFTCKEIDGTFPDARRVIPSESSEGGISDIGFNALYLADFGKVAKIMHGGHSQGIRLIFNGDRNAPAIVKCGSPRFLGVIMPMRV